MVLATPSNQAASCGGFEGRVEQSTVRTRLRFFALESRHDIRSSYREDDQCVSFDFRDTQRDNAETEKQRRISNRRILMRESLQDKFRST